MPTTPKALFTTLQWSPQLQSSKKRECFKSIPDSAFNSLKCDVLLEVSFPVLPICVISGYVSKSDSELSKGDSELRSTKNERNECIQIASLTKQRKEGKQSLWKEKCTNLLEVKERPHLNSWDDLNIV